MDQKAAEIEFNECPICLANIKTYGLLNLCDHLFCLKCILDWSDFTNTQTGGVSCPMCRTISKYIAVSKCPLTGKPKKEYLSQKLVEVLTTKFLSTLILSENQDNEPLDLDTKSEDGNDIRQEHQLPWFLANLVGHH
ncbi:hypothetical protein HDV02_000363 [Globomyces sp. JEL0801]|nr:hypothetical protein HDV02_000363 [Globomyces sp. JEL0801]